MPPMNFVFRCATNVLGDGNPKWGSFFLNLNQGSMVFLTFILYPANFNRFQGGDCFPIKILRIGVSLAPRKLCLQSLLTDRIERNSLHQRVLLFLFYARCAFFLLSTSIFLLSERLQAVKRADSQLSRLVVWLGHSTVVRGRCPSW